MAKRRGVGRRRETNSGGTSLIEARLHPLCLLGLLIIPFCISIGIAIQLHLIDTQSSSSSSLSSLTFFPPTTNYWLPISNETELNSTQINNNVDGHFDYNNILSNDVQKLLTNKNNDTKLQNSDFVSAAADANVNDNSASGNHNNNHNNNNNHRHHHFGNSDNDSFNMTEKEPFLKILQQAGYDIQKLKKNRPNMIKDLPNFSQLNEFYGNGPIILGLETCQEYQDSVPIKDRSFAPAGTFNSGTNLLHALMFENCINPERVRLSKGLHNGNRFQVPWGKHMPPAFRENHTAAHEKVIKIKNVFPIAIIRDPYTWMQSMCRQSYTAQFVHSKEYCPNIKPYETDMQQYPRFRHMDYIPIHVKYDGGIKIKHLSLAHMWNEWNVQYFNYTKNNHPYPRLMVRLEDLLFHGESVITTICNCVGGTMKKENNDNKKRNNNANSDSNTSSFRHHARVANQNAGINFRESDLLDKLIKYGNVANRRKGYPDIQLQAARTLLDPTMMNAFGYPYEPV